MTRSPLDYEAIAASAVAGGVEVPGGAWKARRRALIDAPCDCGRSQPSPREQWKFKGRETLWGGYEFLIWTRQDGKRFARWVR
jgi:hypothetical protein